MTDYQSLAAKYDRLLEPGPSAIAKLLREAGLIELPLDPGPDEIELALRKLVCLVDGADPLRREGIRRATIVFLTQRQVKGADRLVGAAFKLPEEHEDEPQSAPAQPTAEELLAAGRSVIDAPDVLALVEEYVRAAGYAGDTSAAKIIFLAITSRLLARPVNLFLSGPSAGGKNYTVNIVLPLFPNTAYYAVHGQSPLALMYSHETFAHRTLIIAEASAFQRHDDGIGISLLRGIAWDAELNYDTVIDGEAVHLYKAGPTGVITSGTRELEQELSTRMWTVPIPDDPAQTRKVLRATGRDAAGEHDVPGIPAAAFVAAQRYLAAAGMTEVVVPFAPALAELVPVDEVRLRRDFVQLLILVKTHAILHQRHRERDPKGRIIASLEQDYGQVRGLVEPMLAGTVSPGLSKEIRSTVNAVARLITTDKLSVTNTEIATALWAERFGDVAPRTESSRKTVSDQRRTPEGAARQTPARQPTAPGGTLAPAP